MSRAVRLVAAVGMVVAGYVLLVAGEPDREERARIAREVRKAEARKADRKAFKRWRREEYARRA